MKGKKTKKLFNPKGFRSGCHWWGTLVSYGLPFSFPILFKLFSKANWVRQNLEEKQTFSQKWKLPPSKLQNPRALKPLKTSEPPIWLLPFLFILLSNSNLWLLIPFHLHLTAPIHSSRSSNPVACFKTNFVFFSFLSFSFQLISFSPFCFHFCLLLFHLLPRTSSFHLRIAPLLSSSKHVCFVVFLSLVFFSFLQNDASFRVSASSHFNSKTAQDHVFWSILYWALIWVIICGFHLGFKFELDFGLCLGLRLELGLRFLSNFGS